MEDFVVSVSSCQEISIRFCRFHCNFCIFTERYHKLEVPKLSKTKKTRYTVSFWRDRCSVLLVKHFRMNRNLHVFMQLTWIFWRRNKNNVQQILNALSSGLVDDIMHTSVDKCVKYDRNKTKMSKFYWFLTTSVLFSLRLENFSVIKASMKFPDDINRSVARV